MTVDVTFQPLATDDRVAFGQAVLGPVVAEFALHLFILLSSFACPDDAVVLFCARGGLRLKLVYDRFLAAAGLTSPIRTQNLMVSRLVAVRTALSNQRPSAYEEIAYELGGGSMRDTARALCGRDPVADPADPAAWDQPYSSEGFARILASPEGRPVWASIREQAALFQAHLDRCLEGRRHAILCDTGLAGSTIKLLEDGLPDIRWSCALFARSNYKKLSTPHFRRTAGLSAQADVYSPFDATTAVLRYWHLIESVFEPSLSSVATFSRREGAVTSNLETDGWQDRIGPAPGEIFAGILRYFDSLPRQGTVRRIMADADVARRDLRRAVIWPTRAEGRMLETGPRSHDFGRGDSISGLACEPGIRNALRRSLWREGAVALAAPRLRWPLLAGIETAHAARWAYRAARRSFL